MPGGEDFVQRADQHDIDRYPNGGFLTSEVPLYQHDPDKYPREVFLMSEVPLYRGLDSVQPHRP